MKDDIDRIMAVMTAAFDPAYGEAWTRRQVEDALLTGLCHYQLACVNDEPKGFWLSRHISGEEELLLIAVAPQHRGQGIGNKLLSDFVKSAITRNSTRILLEMRSDNPVGSLYKQHNFKPIGIRTNYYRGALGEARDAITFALNVAG